MAGYPRLYPVSFLLVCLACSVSVGDAFVPTTVSRSNWSSVLLAKKKRRRRKSTPPGEPTLPSTPSSADDELPDFDLGEETPSKPKPPVLQTNPDEITAAMMGSATQPVRSIKELINDRSLEKSFEFDEASDELPDFADFAKAAPVGKKRARQEARRSAAVAAQEQDETDLAAALSNVPFITGEDGTVKPNKILEAGAWIGIFLLVGWEVYINSPFFERAAPMAPVVY